MTVFHVRQPLPSSANEILRTYLAPERGLTDQGNCTTRQLGTAERHKKIQNSFFNVNVAFRVRSKSKITVNLDVRTMVSTMFGETC